MTSTHDTLHSSYREMLIEHLFAGAVLRHLWVLGARRLEVLKPQVDDGGYDLVLEAGSIVRHVQMKSRVRGATTKDYSLSLGLAGKPSGCAVVVEFAPDTLELGPFFFFGDAPGRPLPGLDGFRVTRATRGGAVGKPERPNHRTLPLTRFTKLVSVEALVDRLFGEAWGPGAPR